MRGYYRHRRQASIRLCSDELDDDKAVVGEMFDTLGHDELAAIEIEVGATASRCQGAE